MSLITVIVHPQIMDDEIATLEAELKKAQDFGYVSSEKEKLDEAKKARKKILGWMQNSDAVINQGVPSEIEYILQQQGRNIKDITHARVCGFYTNKCVAKVIDYLRDRNIVSYIMKSSSYQKSESQISSRYFRIGLEKKKE